MINQVTKKYFNNNFINYQVVYENGIISEVPLNEDNTDYQAIQKWISEGGVVIDNGGNN